jgi:hypothetical protein
MSYNVTGLHSLHSQWLSKHIPVAANTTMEEMLDALFSLWSVYPLSLLGNGLVTTFLWQQRTVVGIIFYVVRVISKKVGE